VHLAPDEEYVRNRASAIAAISAPRYAAALHAFEATQSDLNAGNLKRAIWSTFEAVETLFRLIAEKAPRLGSRDIDQYLKPVISTIYADEPERRAVHAIGG
jgi:hypothetical protein